MISIRTDLAVEEAETAGETEGVYVSEMHFCDCNVIRSEIKTQAAADKLRKPVGKYITVEFENFSGDEEKFRNIVSKVAHEIRNICPLSHEDSVLVAGLGNENITPDALGPKTGNFVIATRHLKEKAPEYYNAADMRMVSVITPGVLAITGIETAEIIKGIINETSPSALIVIDALASRRMKRLGTTIQISDSGITPGGGVSNARKSISRENLGIPVISVGIPTVVDAATLSCDVIESVAESLKDGISDEKILSSLGSFDTEEKYKLIKECLMPYDLNLVVTPKDIDQITDTCAKILGYSINTAMHGNLSIDDIDSLLA